MDIFRFMTTLSKIAHQMWCYHTFSQINKTAESSVCVCVCVWGGGGGGLKEQEWLGQKLEKKGGGVGPLCQLCPHHLWKREVEQRHTPKTYLPSFKNGYFNVVLGFKLNIIKWSTKTVKAVGKHPQLLGVISQNFETFNPLNPPKLFSEVLCIKWKKKL